MKVGIVGAGGLVGSCAAFALQAGAVCRELVLIDVNQDTARGQALDLLHGSSFAADQEISAGDYGDVADADVVVITAGLRRKPDESRLALIQRNVDLFVGILDSLASAGLNDDAILLVVSNPVDILTHLAVEKRGGCPDRVIGLGTQLDTLRFRSLIARRLRVAATQVRGLILGEHGDSMVPIWSGVQVAGIPIAHWPGWTPNIEQEIAQETRGAGAEVIRLKGGAGFAVGLSIREVVEAILLDRRSVLPVSTLQAGAYGLRRVCLSVPTVVRREGAGARVEVELWPKERTGLEASARALTHTWQEVSRGLTSALTAARSSR